MTLTLAQMDHNALALAAAIERLTGYVPVHHGDGVIGADHEGREVIVSVQDDGTVSVALYTDDGEEVEAVADDLDYDARVVLDAIARLAL